VNWLDYVLVGLAAGFAVEGLVRGFTRQVIGLAATLVAVLLACWFYGTAGAYLIPYVSHKGVASFLGFLFIFIGVQAAGALIGWLLSKMLKTVGLSWMDRLLGVGFGALKGALIGVVLVVALSSFTIKPMPDAVADSRFAPGMVEAGRLLAALTPKEMKDGFDKSYSNLKKFWDERIRPEIDKKVKDRETLPVTGA